MGGVLLVKLKNRNESPVGGFFYDDPITKKVIVTDGNFDKLVNGVREWYRLKGVSEPEKLKELIEDQICTRQPPDRCYYTKGLGDRIAQTIHSVARGVDRVIGTKIERRARGCGKCSQRRVLIN